MSTRNPTAPASDAATPRVPRRRVLQAGAALSLGLAGLPFARRASAGTLDEALRTSPFVYVSPLDAKGRESTCHGEVWYGWLDDTVVLVTERSTWKSRALLKGLDRARIWVGDYGIWKRWWGTNESFRAAPKFDAIATQVRDDALMERLMQTFAAKYPDEFSDWEEDMRSGYASGKRLLIRYRKAS